MLDQKVVNIEPKYSLGVCFLSEINTGSLSEVREGYFQAVVDPTVATDWLA